MRIRGTVANALRLGPVACLLAALVAGCAVSAGYPALDQAQAAVERARSAPRVRALAAAELDLAEIALEHASTAARLGAPHDQVEHLAYVASQRAALAEARAAAQVARSETMLLRRTLNQVAFEASSEERHKQRLLPKTRPARAPLDEDRQEGASAEDQAGRAAEPDPVAADVETRPRDVTLDLAQLPFEQAEPTDQALEELAALTERLLREPGRNLLIEADFDLPEPEARTVMERRVEVVRAFFLARGVAPVRVVVQAGGDDPAQPQTSAFVEAPE